MQFLNCTLKEACSSFKNKRIIFFGCGSWLNTVNYTKFMDLEEFFCYVVDNAYDKKKSVKIGRKELTIYSPEKLYKETECIIILTSPVYMYDMFCQLQDMKLNDSIACYAFPFIQLISEVPIETSLLKRVTSCEKEKIPRIIHCFWFSGEEKPEAYRRCLDTWKRHLDGYEIMEWNQNNYDVKKNKFLQKAIECGAWAFASDYARLDVLKEYGGIYLDMDVEVYKTFDDLLGNEGILSYSNNVQIDLAVMGAITNNKIINDLLKVYDNIEVPTRREDFAKYFQPTLVKSTLAKNGIAMDGSLQIIDGATIFPHSFFMPQDHVLFLPFEKTEYTYCNHLDNFGWSFSKENKKTKKIRDNNILWRKLKHDCI